MKPWGRPSLGWPGTWEEGGGVSWEWGRGPVALGGGEPRQRRANVLPEVQLGGGSATQGSSVTLVGIGGTRGLIGGCRVINGR